MNWSYTRDARALKQLADRQIEKTEPLAVTHVEKGLILPWLNARSDGNPSSGLGGVLDAEGRFVSQSRYEGDWLVNGGAYEYARDSVETMEGQVLYFGPFFPHWGHFLVDLVNRLWVVSERSDYRGWKVAYTSLNGGRIDGVFREFFALLGVSPDDLIPVDRPTRFGSVLVPEPAHLPNAYYSREFLGMFRRVARAACAGVEVAPRRNIYLTRTHHADARRKESGEMAIQRWFGRNGFEVISPESLSLVDQIRTVNSAATVACVNGSIPLNMVFVLGNTEYVVLNKTSMLHGNCDTFRQMTGVTVTYVDAYREPLGQPRWLGAGPFLLVVSEQLRSFFRDRKMIVPGKVAAAVSRSVETMLFIARFGIMRPLKACVRRLARVFGRRAAPG